MQASYKGLANFVQQWKENVFVSSDVALGLLVGVSGWGAGIPAIAAGRAFAGRHWDVGELPKSSAGMRAFIRRISPPPPRARKLLSPGSFYKLGSSFFPSLAAQMLWPPLAGISVALLGLCRSTGGVRRPWCEA